MHPDRWRRVEEVFHAALERASADRATFVTDTCDGDEALRSEVQALLEKAETTSGFLGTPAIEVAVSMADMTESVLPPIGQAVSHYQILERLGAGGMGIVYKAEDLRLKRLVALKFLPYELTSNPEAKRRLIHEAQAASALDHPHICTIHEIDETTDGRLFIAMAFYEGETLKERIAGSRLEPADAIRIAVQIAGAVAAAHNAGIIHRDIKPGNIIVTRRGEVKLVDFGIATHDGQTRLTRTGTTLGTIGYMSPEQISGIDADARSDVWSLGVVLFEMLTGRLPFEGRTEVVLMNAILHQAVPRLHDVRPEVSLPLDDIVARALSRNPADRYANADALVQALAPLLPGVMPVADDEADARAAGMRRRTNGQRRAHAALAIGSVLVIAAPAGWWLKHQFDVLEARNRTLPEVRRLIGEDRSVEALALVTAVERLLRNDPAVDDLRARLSVTLDIESSPAGAQVSIRDTALQTDWHPLGRTPLVGARVPRGTPRWKFELPGFDAAEFISPAGPPLGGDKLTVRLARTGELPPNMVRISGSALRLTFTGFDSSKSIDVAEYLIDRFEVRNREFKEFVDRGGYARSEYWKHRFVKDGATISWRDAMALFKDQTGRPGPATWEVGTFPKDQDDYPVSGVSWYEAAAYAEFRGKSLPTVYHWTGAAGTFFAAHITPLSNMRGSGPLPVGRTTAVSTSGLSDVAGNVKEWAWNEEDADGNRYVIGGAWNEPQYMFYEAETRSPFERAANIGFRCARYPMPESAPAATFASLGRISVRDYSIEKPPPDEIFSIYKELFAYDPTPLDPRVERIDDSSKVWRRDKVSINAAYGHERVIAHLFIPKQHKPPHQLVLYWPGSDAISQRSSDSMGTMAWDYLVVSGRAVLVPVYYGTFERNDGKRRDSWPNTSRAYRDWAIKQVQDARRALDYATTRADLRADAIGYLGFSWGARMAPQVLAQEPRLKAAVLGGGGLSPGPAPPEVDGFTFAPRVSAPVLMFNGHLDLIFDLERSQKPLFRMLGTPAEHKRHIVVPGGHGVFFEKRSQFIREVLDWFDRYLGPVP